MTSILSFSSYRTLFPFIGLPVLRSNITSVFLSSVLMIALIYFHEGDTSMLLNSFFLSSISDFAPEGRLAFAIVKNNERFDEKINIIHSHHNLLIM